VFSLEIISRGAAWAAEITLTLHGAQLTCSIFTVGKDILCNPG
jgi:hypothetical protein